MMFMSSAKKILRLPIVLPALFGGILLFGGMVGGEEITYSADKKESMEKIAALLPASAVSTEPKFVVTHTPPPEPLKAVYMTSCIASGKKLRAPLVKLIDETELNAVVIDIKDYTGMISFDLSAEASAQVGAPARADDAGGGDPRFVLNTKGCHVPDIKEFIGELHEKKIYVVGRVTVMQDSTYPKAHPDAAVKKKSDGGIWKDKKGLTFVDPGATEYWAYMSDLGKASYAVGFDEINYDYIRFPSDGNMSDIAFLRTGTTTKPAMMKKFYAYLGKEMSAAKIPISADLFGMTTTNTDDLNIGQILEDALLYFDYVAPMVYPSHYPPGFNGWKDPNQVPYEIIKFSMERAVLRANKLEEKLSGYVAAGTTTPPFLPTGKYAKKLRPWIQDFDYGKDYAETDVRAQKKATYDAGLTSWMSWDPSNKYTWSAYDRE